MKPFLVLILMVCSITSTASPWPVDVSVAFTVELSMACALAYPQSAPSYHAQRERLFLEDINKVKQVEALERYPDVRKWAHDVIVTFNSGELSKACFEFLAKTEINLKEPDPDDQKFVPVK